MVFIRKTQDDSDTKFFQVGNLRVMFFFPICHHKKNTIIQLITFQQLIMMSKNMYNTFRDVSFK